MLSQLKDMVKRGLRPDAPSPEILLDLEGTRAELEALSRQVSALTDEPRPGTGGHDVEIAKLLQPEVDRLSELVSGLLDRVHAHEERLDQLQGMIERFGGSALEGVAVERRLATIEDHLAIDAREA